MLQLTTMNSERRHGPLRRRFFLHRGEILSQAEECTTANLAPLETPISRLAFPGFDRFMVSARMRWFAEIFALDLFFFFDCDSPGRFCRGDYFLGNFAG